MTPAQIFGRNLREKRKEKSLTLKEVAAQIGCHLVTLSQIERGEQTCSLNRADALAKVLGLEPWDLMQEAPAGRAKAKAV